MCNVHWRSVSSGSPVDDNSRANLPSCRSGGQFVISFFISFPEIVCCWCAPPYRSIFYQLQWSQDLWLFSFSPVHFPSSFSPLHPLFYPSSINSCLLSPSVLFVLNPLLLSPFLLLTCCVFSIHKIICMSGNQLWKLHVQIAYHAASCQCCPPTV